MKTKKLKYFFCYSSCFSKLSSAMMAINKFMMIADSQCEKDKDSCLA